MVTHIVIPVRGQLHLTESIVAQLEREVSWDTCWIFDNGSEDDTWNYLQSLSGPGTRFRSVMASEHGIYEMWGDGFKLAKTNGADVVAFLNNDLSLAPNTIERLAKALTMNQDACISYPDYSNATRSKKDRYKKTNGTYRHGGMSGFCFVLRVDCVDWEPLVDPQFRWWGGDDDIAFSIEDRGGQQVRVLGLPVTHLMEGTARHYDLEPQKGADFQAVLEKWGR